MAAEPPSGEEGQSDRQGLLGRPVECRWWLTLEAGGQQDIRLETRVAGADATTRERRRRPTIKVRGTPG